MSSPDGATLDVRRAQNPILFKLALVMFTIHTRCCPDYLTDSVQACNSDLAWTRLRSAMTMLFHRQERNLATEPSQWPTQL